MPASAPANARPRRSSGGQERGIDEELKMVDKALGYLEKGFPF